MKIGDKIIIDKEFYIKRYKETFGEDIQIDGLTNNNKIETYLHQAIKNNRELIITDISAEHNNESYQLIIHLIDNENHDGSLCYSYIKDDSEEKYTNNGVFDYYNCGLDIIKKMKTNER